MQQTAERITPSPPHPVTLPSHIPAASPPHNLPAQTTPFIGRAQELADILQRLHDPACRLLTLIGPGGIGKTRLALEVAQAILEVRFGIGDAAEAETPKAKSQNFLMACSLCPFSLSPRRAA